MDFYRPFPRSVIASHKLPLTSIVFLVESLFVAVQYMRSSTNASQNKSITDNGKHSTLAQSNYGDDHELHTRTNREHEQGRHRGRPRSRPHAVRRFRAPVRAVFQRNQGRI